MLPLFLRPLEKTLAEQKQIGYLNSREDNEYFHFTPEFPTDLNRPYDPDSHDQRTNEIHELRWDNSGYVHLVADMIQGSFYCQSSPPGCGS